MKHSRRLLASTALLLVLPGMALARADLLLPSDPMAQLRTAGVLLFVLLVPFLAILAGGFLICCFLSGISAPAEEPRDPRFRGLPARAPQDLARPEVACPYCGEHPRTRRRVSCASCETLHHHDCWREARGCTIYGCGEEEARDWRPSTRPWPSASASAPSSGRIPRS